jgi:hypothetical protein
MKVLVAALLMCLMAPTAQAQTITIGVNNTVTVNGVNYNVSVILTPVGPVIVPVPVILPAGFRTFPANDPWNTDIGQMPVDANSATYLTSIGLASPIHPDFGAGTNGIPFNVIDSSKVPLVPISFNYADESDPGPYPIPVGAIVEPPTDSHLLLVDPIAMREWDIFGATLTGGAWHGSSGAIWNLSNLAAGQRKAGWTSADAAGLPIFPGLVRFGEVQSGVINHALRFTVPKTRRAYLSPASHWASTSTDPTLPPMGLRLRLKASVNTSTFSKPVQVICAALKRYGMLLADNGGAWFVSGEPGAWDDTQLADLKLLHGTDLEVVNTGAILTADTAPVTFPGPPVISQYLGPGRTPLPLNPTVAQGSILFVEGIYFGSTPGKAQFNGLPVTILSWGDSEIAFAVPFVSTNGALSTITITRSDASYYMSAAIKVQ